jgi:hypothetical protein
MKVGGMGSLSWQKTLRCLRSEAASNPSWKGPVLFVKINFRIQTITFRCISRLEMQNGYTLYHNFSRLANQTFACQSGPCKRPFSPTHEKVWC